MILGLPLSSFALQMISVIGSLLGIIFSFSLGVIVSVLLWNIILYIILTTISRHPELLNFKHVFSQTISNKKPGLSYEDD